MKRLFFALLSCLLLLGSTKTNVSSTKTNVTREYVIWACVKSLSVNEYNSDGAVINTRTVFFTKDDSEKTVISAEGATSVGIPRQKVRSLLTTSYSYYIGSDEKYALPSGGKKLHLSVLTESISASTY